MRIVKRRGERLLEVSYAVLVCCRHYHRASMKLSHGMKCEKTTRPESEHSNAKSQFRFDCVLTLPTLTFCPACSIRMTCTSSPSGSASLPSSKLARRRGSETYLVNLAKPSETFQFSPVRARGR